MRWVVCGHGVCVDRGRRAESARGGLTRGVRHLSKQLVRRAQPASEHCIGGGHELGVILLARPDPPPAP
eukprot:scaffold1385_cov34-Tisochrysis_lutea.AAC.1